MWAGKRRRKKKEGKTSILTQCENLSQRPQPPGKTRTEGTNLPNITLTPNGCASEKGAKTGKIKKVDQKGKRNLTCSVGSIQL